MSGRSGRSSPQLRAWTEAEDAFEDGHSRIRGNVNLTVDVYTETMRGVYGKTSPVGAPPSDNATGTLHVIEDWVRILPVSAWLNRF